MSLDMPTLYLPSDTARHLRALVYASSPGSTVTSLSLTSPPCQTISLTGPRTLELQHPPCMRTRANAAFLSFFPLCATLTPPNITFSTTLPDTTIELGSATALPSGKLIPSATLTLLRVGAASCQAGLVRLVNGRYEPVLGRADPPVVGAWASASSHADTAAVLLLARFLARRVNRRLGGHAPVRRHVVLLRFGDPDVTFREGLLEVHGVARWACHVPLAGGSAEFRRLGNHPHKRIMMQNNHTRAEAVDDGIARTERGSSRTKRTRRPDSTGSREGRLSRGHDDASEDRDVGGVEEKHPHDVEEATTEVDLAEDPDDELLHAKMREIRFPDPAPPPPASCVLGADPRHGNDIPRIVDVGDMADVTCDDGSVAWSDDDVSSGEEASVMDALCREYLQDGWEASVRRERARLK